MGKGLKTAEELGRPDRYEGHPRWNFLTSVECPDCCKPMDFVKSIRVGTPGHWRDEYTCICGTHLQIWNNS